jgi:hypothetical protein
MGLPGLVGDQILSDFDPDMRQAALRRECPSSNRPDAGASSTVVRAAIATSIAA